MVVRCAWCKKVLGEKAPLDDKSVTDGICRSCIAEQRAGLRTTQQKVKTGAWWDVLKTVRGEPPMFCPGCGIAHPVAMRFCSECGSPMLAAPSPAYDELLEAHAAYRAQAGAPAIAKPEVTVSNVYRGKQKQVVGAAMLVVGIFGMLGSCTIRPAGDGSTGAFFAFLSIAVVGLVVKCAGSFEHWYHAE